MTFSQIQYHAVLLWDGMGWEEEDEDALRRFGVHDF